MSVTLAAERPTSRSLGLVNGFARRVLADRLRNLRGGQLTLIDHAGESTLGHGTDLQATLRIHDQRFFRHAVFGGSLSIAESYLRGQWDCDNLTALFRIFLRNLDTTDRMDRGS